MSDTRLRVASIGAGYFAAMQIEAWARNPQAVLVGVADLDQAKAEAAVAPIGGVPTFSDAAAMLARTAPDIVDIAAPPAAHADLIRLAMTTEARAIICQKPFCGNLADARVIADEAAALGKLLIVHENFRFQPWFRDMARYLSEGLIGDLFQITFRLRPGDGQGPQAYLDRQPYFQTMERFLIHETAIHFIDTFRFLMGEPQAVTADLRQLNPAIAGEDAGVFSFHYPDGKRAVFDGNRLVDHVADNTRYTMGECHVEGRTGTLRLDGFGRIFHRVMGEQAETRLGPDYDATHFAGDCVYLTQAHIASHLREGTPLENTAAEYLRNLEIEEAIYRAAEIAPTPV